MPVPDAQQSAPGSEPLPSWSDRMKSGAGNLATGFMRGGPIGLATAGMGEGMKTIGDYTNKLAYNAGGAVTDVLAPHVPPEVAGGAGYAANVATQAVPVVLGSLLGNATEPLGKAAGKRLMQSALKPGVKDIRTGNAERAVETLLDEGVNVSGGGAVKLQTGIDELNKQVAQKIASASGTVPKSEAGHELAKTLRKFKQQVNPSADEEAILNAWKEFSTRYGQRMPVQQAQAVKQGTYGALAGKYGEQGSASTEAQKALARGLRQGIEKIEPSVRTLNQREGDLINALEMVERRTGVAGNRDIGGLAWIANDPKAAAAFFAGRSELLKSFLARSLYSGSGPIGTAAGAGVGGVLGLESGRSE